MGVGVVVVGFLGVFMFMFMFAVAVAVAVVVVLSLEETVAYRMRVLGFLRQRDWSEKSKASEAGKVLRSMRLIWERVSRARCFWGMEWRSWIVSGGGMVMFINKYTYLPGI